MVMMLKQPVVPVHYLTLPVGVNRRKRPALASTHLRLVVLVMRVVGRTWRVRTKPGVVGKVVPYDVPLLRALEAAGA
jgi:hypothetical protein